MADNINISFGEIANALKSLAQDHILGVAADIYDESLGKYQSEINEGITDTKVTSVDNHYAPTENTASQLSASAAGATAAWSIDVVKGVTIKRDAKGHVVGVGVTSGKIPANPNTDTKNTAGSTDSTSKMFLIGATSQAANPQTYSNSKIYATNGVLTTEGGINLYKSSGDSPYLTFLRGTATDSSTDWRMYVTSGMFKIQNQINSGGWKDVLSLEDPERTHNITSSYHIIPSVNDTLDLGSLSYKWRNIYGSSIYENGTVLSEKYALKSKLDNIVAATNEEIDNLF